MPNRIITPTKVLREALRVLHNNTAFVRGVDRQYSKEFAIPGAKIGNSINVRVPNRYYVSRQTALQSQDTQESTVPVTLTTNYQIGLNFTAQDLLLSLDDFSKRIITPAMAAMSSAMDYDGLGLYKYLFNQVGTPGTAPGAMGGTAGTMTDSSAPRIFANAGAMLDLMSCPKDTNRWIILEPLTQASAISGLAGLLNPAPELNQQYRTGEVKNGLGFHFDMDQNVNCLVAGVRTATNAQVASAGQTGSSIVTNGWSANAVLNVGEIITFALTYSVNPENQQTTRLLANFVVTATTTADASGNMTIPIYPAIVPAGAQIANGTVVASPAMGAAVSLLSGANSLVSPQNMAYHSDCFTLATADKQLPGGVDFAARENYEGISMTLIRQYDINTDQYPCRLDVLAGWACLRPELGVRIVA